MEPTGVAFTRYLYEYHQVKYSLLFALLAKSREEALFWVYELYHSGFREPVWYWVRDIYVDYYEETHPSFKAKIDNWFLEWQESEDAKNAGHEVVGVRGFAGEISLAQRRESRKSNACLIGTVVGTLAIMNTVKNAGHEVVGVQGFAGEISEAQRRESRKSNREVNRNKQIIILYKEDRHQTLDVGKSRHYLKQVSQYPIRQEAKDLVKDVLGVSLGEVREAYLGMNWLYYCAETPIWESRILEGGGVVDYLGKRVAFGNDDLLEAFYERWGFEPDEQCAEMHRWHGVDY